MDEARWIFSSFLLTGDTNLSGREVSDVEMRSRPRYPDSDIEFLTHAPKTGDDRCRNPGSGAAANKGI